MSEKAVSDRTLRVAPLVLRWGLAAILIYHGFGLLSPIWAGESGQSLEADGAGVALAANWSNLIGAGELVVGTLLAVGFMTRLTAFGVLGAVGYAIGTAVWPQGDTLNAAAALFESSRAGTLLLGAACASLLVSGAGCLGVDCRSRRNVPAKHKSGMVT